MFVFFCLEKERTGEYTMQFNQIKRGNSILQNLYWIHYMRQQHLELSFVNLNWLNIVLRPLENFSLIQKRHHCQCKTVKFRPMLGAQGLWAGTGLYRATPAVFVVSSKRLIVLNNKQGLLGIYSDIDSKGI
jgi:hypothetical protein